ncbi:GNAT family N-acetyltransferase [Hymenobacter actinosclerus]|uniref:Acetyltransferase (GNAT) domain-containing protein n=1 Tax=Hymenobacter actinosclerus TaxID=82805 RepID=A0A1I0J948_9BACT|nr:GNAT family N-acetyltransferase [Hymenobacter actinosclerus]SEU05620.1 Acetyltransferase (GNAT) domain-containing protein [Hymenobacter actinosclerus]
MPPLRLLRFSQLDLAAWDACVAGARQAVPYAHSWWLQATAGRWDALVQQEPDGRYRSVWPLPAKWRPGGRQVYQPPFTQQLGLISGADDAPAIGPALPPLAQRYARFYAQLNEANGLPAAAGQFTVEARQTYHLDLSPAYDTLRAGYCADYRRRLLRHEAAAAPLIVTELPDPEPLLTLFQQTKGPAAGLRPRHYARLRRLLAGLQRRQLLEARAVRAPETGALLAGALFVRYRSRLIYLFAAASDEGKKAAAPLLLLDEAIRRHAGTPGLVLDFEGGMLPAIARFFANFGAAPVPYAALSFTSESPWYLKWMR